ncbi:probable RNA-binding protein EIF1AD [Macrosteles quadrilineatus]|uniref:probable RNA-binding protein EIF1AD n=1 Tax=Macrosteles quadrilineatus TaxID=74068 RepID=UPI0023E15C22|nr:probable RNA-binding protein EIF1AD [Macrosteles quadrilineatus]
MSTSSSTKRKHVYSELLQPELRVPRENQQIVRLTGGRGNHLHDAETPEGDKFIVSMPTKFRKSVWVKRGDYVLVESIPEGDKVKAEIVTVLTKDHIRFYKNQKCWPDQFEEKSNSFSVQPRYETSSSSSSTSDED